MNIGKNIQLSLEELSQAAQIRAYEVAKSRGALSPGCDLVDFMNRSQVHFELTTAMVDNVPNQVVKSAYVTLSE